MTKQLCSDRYNDLKKMLEERRSAIRNDIQERMRLQRESNQWGKVGFVQDPAETCGADLNEEIELALIKMKAETLKKIDDALVRLEQGAYGYCEDCGKETSDKRLRALPFAVRCKRCEEAREEILKEQLLKDRKNLSLQFYFL